MNSIILQNIDSESIEHSLESHEAMQQTSAANIFDVPTSNHSSNSNKQSFLHGKLIIHEEEPIIEEGEGDEDEQLITRPEPTQAMFRERRQHKVSHSHFQ